MRKECDRAKLAREIKEHLVELELMFFIDGVTPIMVGTLDHLRDGQKLIFKKLEEIDKNISS